MASHGWAWLGMVRYGVARLALARRGAAGLGVAILLAGSIGTAGAHSPIPPRQAIPDSEFHEVIYDLFPGGTPIPRPVIAVPTPRLIVEPRPTPPPAPHSPTVAEAKAWAMARLGATQYACLADIIKHEDGSWDPFRLNLSSGAYGIPQALPGSKMATAGADWRWNRITQVRWMIGYVNGRYGSACQAATYRNQHGWY